MFRIRTLEFVKEKKTTRKMQNHLTLHRFGIGYNSCTSLNINNKYGYILHMHTLLQY